MTAAVLVTSCTTSYEDTSESTANRSSDSDITTSDSEPEITSVTTTDDSDSEV